MTSSILQQNMSYPPEYPAMPKYESYHQQYSSGRPLSHSTSQQQYYTQRPSVPQQHQSWSAPPPPYSVSSVCPPPPPPRPTPQPSYNAELAIPNLPNPQAAFSHASSSPGRPVSPLPASEAEYRSRLEAAGVSPEQITMILGQQAASQDTKASNDRHKPMSSLQNLSLDGPAKTDHAPRQPYPFNLPKSAPIVLHSVDPPGPDDNTFYIGPPNMSVSDRLYTAEFFDIPDKSRPGLRLRHHMDQDTAYSREAGSCVFSAKTINPKFAWLEWGEWGQSSGTRSDHFISDTGISNQTMYFEKEVAGYHGNPTIFKLRCKVTDQDLEAEPKPKPDDRVVMTMDVHAEGGIDEITIAPGVVGNQDQLDEMLMLTLCMKQKFHLDMVVWLADQKKLDINDMSKFDDLSMVPDDVNGWGGENGSELAVNMKAARKARWKERAKMFGASAKLAHQVGQLSMNIAAMNGTPINI